MATLSHDNRSSHGLPVSVTIVNESTPLVPQHQAKAETLDLSLSLSSDPSLRKKEILGLLLMTFSALAFATMSLCVKLSAENIPSFEIVLSRSVVQLTLALLSCAVLRINPLGKKGVRRWLFFRALVMSIGLALFFYSITVLSLIEATGPTFTAIVASVILNEPFTLFDGFCSVLCLVGVFLVAKPQFLFGLQDEESYELKRMFAITCSLAGAITSAMAFATVRKIGKGTHFMVHTVYFAAVSAMISPPGMLVFQQFVLPVKDWVTLSLVGVFAFVGQCLLNQGLKLAPAGPGTLTRMIEVIFAFLFGMTLLGEHPDRHCFLGAALIVGMTTALGIHKWHSQAVRAAAIRKRRSRERLNTPGATRS